MGRLADDSPNPFASPSVDTEHAGPNDASHAAPWGGPITLEGALSAADLRRAFSSARLLRYRIAWLILVVVLVPIFIVGFILSVGDYSSGKSSIFGPLLIGSGLLGIGAFLGFFVASQILLGLASSRGKGVFQPCKVIVDNEGLHITTEFASSDVAWKSFSKFWSLESLVVLYDEPSQSLRVLARAMLKDGNDWDRLVSLVATKVPRHYRNAGRWSVP